MKNVIRLIARILVMALVVFVLGSCGQQTTETTVTTTAPVETTEQVVEETTVTEVVDMAGNTITLTQAPSAVFCQSSLYEQMVLALGAESTLRASTFARTDDARSIWCQTLYPQVLELEPSGGDQGGITNELLVSYELDLMFVGNQDQYNEFTALGIPCVVLDIQSLDDLMKGIEIMGACLGGAYQQKAESILAYCGDLLAQVEEKTAQIAEEDKLTAYFMESRYASHEATLYMTWGPDSFQANCLKLAGVNTVADDLFEGGVRAEVTAEQLLLSDPDVIVIGGFYEQTNYDALLQESTLQTLTAVNEGKIYRVPVGASEWTRIGVESFLLPMWYGTVLYPEVYSDVDMEQLVQDFYQQVMGVTLSAEYQSLILARARGPAQ